MVERRETIDVDKAVESGFTKKRWKCCKMIEQFASKLYHQSKVKLELLPLQEGLEKMAEEVNYWRKTEKKTDWGRLMQGGKGE